MILIYLLKSALCLGILFGFYKLALEGKAMHHFKRFYLLASLVFSFTIPLITFTYQAAEAPQITPIFQEYVETVSAPNQVPRVAEVDYTNTAIWGIYLLGVFIFGTRFIVNLVRLKRKIHQAELHPSSHFTLALLEQVMVPHSFLKWIFVNRQSYTQQEIAPEVLAHEATHVRQRHSLDIIAIEFIQVIFWFNPLVWLYKGSIKLNHEFLADQGAIVDKSNIAIYQNILLSYASSTHHTALESPFNYSLTKKRIVMLSQSFSRKKVVLRALLLIPVVTICLLLFNQGIIAQEKPKEQKAPQTSTYATQFVEGATRNGKNALVIEVRNDSIYINGQYSPLDSFRESVDNITAQWTKEEFAQPVRSMIFKGNSKGFINKAEAVFRQTQLYKANNSLRLIPPPPPAPPAPRGELPPPPPPPSPEEHLLKMHKLSSLFIYNGKEVTYEEAVRLAKGGVTEIKTPYPYSNPPKTFIGSTEPIKPNVNKKVGANLSNKKGQGNVFKDPNTYQTIYQEVIDPASSLSQESYPKSVGFTVSTIDEVSEKIRSTEATDKAVASFLEENNIDSKNVTPISTSYSKPNKSTRVMQRTSVIKAKVAGKQAAVSTQKGNHFEVKASYDEDGSLSKNVEQHALNGGTFEFEGKEISKEDAILKSKEPNITIHISSFHNKMIFIKNFLTSKANYYLNDKLLSEDEITQFGANYKTVLISRGSEKEKPSFKFVKIKE
ncbi:M56 family metallopeptidase [Dokdonia sp. LLG6352-1]|uniref:M56 family metallopeptidase n=1 Tax=Dokdonia sp. LLG6352-1 TaxID=3160831 RepID=UPI003863A021